MGNDEMILKIHHIDIGQGDASLIVVKKGHKTEGSLSTIYKAVLIDSGENLDIGKRIVTYLKQVLLHKRDDGVVEHKTLDTIVCTHYDADHIKGFPAIIKSEFCDENTKIYDQGIWKGEGLDSKVYGQAQRKSLLSHKRMRLMFKLFCNSDLYNKDDLIILSGKSLDLEQMERDDFKNKVKIWTYDWNSKSFPFPCQNVYDAVYESIKFIITNSQLTDDNLKAALKGKVKDARRTDGSKICSSDQDVNNKAEQLKNSVKSLQQQFDHCLERFAVTLKNYTREESKDEKILLETELFDLSRVFPAGNPIPTMTCIAANGYVLDDKSKQTIDASGSGTEKNQRSLAFLIEYGNFAYYTGGDIGNGQEKRIAAYLDSKCTKLNAFKVSHHGSDHSTPDEFLKQVKDPCAAFISYGWDNGFLHPKRGVIRKLLEKKLIVYFTSLFCKVKTLPKSSDKDYSEYKSIREVVNLEALANIYKNQAEIGIDSRGEIRKAASGTIALTVTSTEIGQPNVPLKISYDRIFFDQFANLSQSGIRISPKLYSEMAEWITQPEKCPGKDKKGVSRKRSADEMGRKLQEKAKKQQIENDSGNIDSTMVTKMETEPSIKDPFIEAIKEIFKLMDDEKAKEAYTQFIFPLFESMVNINTTLKKPRFTWTDGSKVIAKLVDVIR